jgi:CheY-like chemotaxis protein
MAPSEDTVLVLEDEEDARAFLTQILQFEGFRVVALSNGAEAVDYLTRSEVPCLILMEIRMPVMDGRQFRAALLQDARLADIPVVIVTALDPSVATGMSALRVFRKPIDVDALLSVVRENCQARQKLKI